MSGVTMSAAELRALGLLLCEAGGTVAGLSPADLWKGRLKELARTLVDKGQELHAMAMASAGQHREETDITDHAAE